MFYVVCLSHALFLNYVNQLVSFRALFLTELFEELQLLLLLLFLYL